MDERVEDKNENNEEQTQNLIDLTWKGIYKLGAFCMIGLGLIYIIATLLNLTIAVPPNDTITFFNSLADHASLARFIYILYSLAAFLLLIATMALYHALKRINKNAMLVAAGLLFLFVILDLTLTEFNSLTLVTLAQHYTYATVDAQRVAYLTAADYLLATIPIATFYSWMVGSLGFLIASAVMLKGVFNKRIAYSGIIINLLGIIGAFYIFLPVLTIFLTPILIIWGIWLMIVGFRLYNISSMKNIN